MKTFEILKIHTHNFKGLSECLIDITGQKLNILGGRNGFGKTSLFDAVELVLTGTISRYEKYTKDKDKRNTYSQEYKPLVCDKDIPDVKVELLASTENGPVWLKREAKVAALKNPISFDAFKDLYIKQSLNKDAVEYTICDENTYEEIIPESIKKKYTFLHYLDQEDGTVFLKTKDKNRSELVSKLFDIKNFDEDIKKATECVNSLKSIGKRFEQEIGTVDKNIRSLKATPSLGDGDTNSYIRLLSQQEKWDMETPKLSPDEYMSLLSEDGLISNLSYYAANKDEYRKYENNQYLNKLLLGVNLKSLAIYVFFNSKRAALQLYKTFTTSIKPMIVNIDTKSLRHLVLEKNDLLISLIGEEIIEATNTTSKELLCKYNSLTQLQREYANIQDKRDNIALSLKSRSFKNTTACPLCGHDYEGHEELLLRIELFGKSLKAHSDSIMTEIRQSVELFRQHCIEEIVNPLDEYFSTQEITQEILDKYDENNKNILKVLFLRFNLHIEIKAHFDGMLSYLSDLLKSKLQEYNQELDYKRLQKIHQSYAESMLPEMLTVENVEKKKRHLISEWNKKKSKLLAEWEAEKQRLTNVKTKVNNRRIGIKSLHDSIAEQRKQYVSKLISDIEILFHIYSGRIMQDCYFGRGVFMENKDNKRVMFVANTHNSDIDVLYNMSSGQLMAIILAFTLTLNKLYADCKFLAIDDPVQTIDDMNFWGFMETLRHEFKDHSILMSTHEEPYGALLRYKANKLGMSARYYDMKDVRENTETKNI